MQRDTYERFEKLRVEYRDWLERFHELYTTTLYNDRDLMENTHSALFLAAGIYGSEMHSEWRRMFDAEQLDKCTEHAVRDRNISNPTCDVCGKPLHPSTCGVMVAGGRSTHLDCYSIQSGPNE